MFSFFCAGKCEPAGSKTAFVNKHTGRAIITDACKNSKPWKQEVANAAREAMAKCGAVIDRVNPIFVHAVFYMKRPKAHYKKDGSLKDNAPLYCLTKPDSSKLFRAAEDALTGIVWNDDTQVQHNAMKLYENAFRPPGVYMRIATLANEPYYVYDRELIEGEINDRA